MYMYTHTHTHCLHITVMITQHNTTHTHTHIIIQYNKVHMCVLYSIVRSEVKCILANHLTTALFPTSIWPRKGHSRTNHFTAISSFNTSHRAIHYQQSECRGRAGLILISASADRNKDKSSDLVL